MNNTKLFLLLALSLVAVACADLSLTSTALVRERQYYESTVNYATQVPSYIYKSLPPCATIILTPCKGSAQTVK